MTEIEATVKALQKKYGVTIGSLNDKKSADIGAVTTGLLPLDIALGIGGIPMGYYVEVFAPEGVGKTTLCLQIVAQMQKEGIVCAYIDMEHRVDKIWAEILGVDLDSLYFTQPSYGEAALNIARALIGSGVRLVIIDSVPALIPKTELEGDTGDQFVGLLPRMLSQNLRQMTHSMKENEATVIFTNQIRAKIGGGGSLARGPGQTQPGGWALKHNASIRLDMRRIKTLKEKEQYAGQIVKVTVKKNSLATPYREAIITLRHGRGFDPVEGIVDLGIVHGLIDQAGAWYTLYGQKYQGKGNVVASLTADPAIAEKLRNEIMEKLYGSSKKDNG